MMFSKEEKKHLFKKFTIPASPKELLLEEFTTDIKSQISSRKNTIIISYKYTPTSFHDEPHKRLNLKIIGDSLSILLQGQNHIRTLNLHTSSRNICTSDSKDFAFTLRQTSINNINIITGREATEYVTSSEPLSYGKNRMVNFYHPKIQLDQSLTPKGAIISQLMTDIDDQIYDLELGSTTINISASKYLKGPEGFVLTFQEVADILRDKLQNAPHIRNINFNLEQCNNLFSQENCGILRKLGREGLNIEFIGLIQSTPITASSPHLVTESRSSDSAKFSTYNSPNMEPEKGLSITHPTINSRTAERGLHSIPQAQAYTAQIARVTNIQAYQQMPYQMQGTQQFQIPVSSVNFNPVYHQAGISYAIPVPNYIPSIVPQNTAVYQPHTGPVYAHHVYITPYHLPVSQNQYPAAYSSGYSHNQNIIAPSWQIQYMQQGYYPQTTQYNPYVQPAYQQGIVPITQANTHAYTVQQNNPVAPRPYSHLTERRINSTRSSQGQGAQTFTSRHNNGLSNKGNMTKEGVSRGRW